MADILRRQTVKTRKPHRCWGCGKEYPAGSEMANAAYVDGGRAFSCYWCKTCEGYMQQNFEPGDECGCGEIYENDPDGWNEIHADILKHEQTHESP